MHRNFHPSLKYMFDVGIKLLLCNIQMLASLVSRAKCRPMYLLPGGYNRPA